MDARALNAGVQGDQVHWTEEPLASQLRSSPLFPVALAVTAGVVLDRQADLPVVVSLLVAVSALVAWFLSRSSSSSHLGLVYLVVAGVAVGAALHQDRHRLAAPDDIGRRADDVPRPVHVRGIVEEAPRVWRHDEPDPMGRTPRSSGVLQLTALHDGEAWLTASGRVRLSVAGEPAELLPGDAVEVVGRLSGLAAPFNPGEPDHAATLRDRGIHAILVVAQAPDGVTRLERGWPRSIPGWLAAANQCCQAELLREGRLSPRGQGMATALLLGEPAELPREAWAMHVRTGVVHVLVISGQQISLLGGFLWFALVHVLRREPRRSAAVIGLFLLAYALLVGGDPPVLRSAVVALVLAGSRALSRPTPQLNSLALGWLVIVALRPADVFRPGCQLSFLSIAFLYWAMPNFPVRPVDSLERLVDETRPSWLRVARLLGRWVAQAYLFTAVLWLTAAPLLAVSYQQIPLAGLLIGPPVVLLTTVAMVLGFLLLLVSPVPPLADLLAVPVDGCLRLCDNIVTVADGWLPPIAAGGLPVWWAVAGYAGLLAFLLTGRLGMRSPAVWVAGLGWLAVGLASVSASLAPDELRCTFLAVGHGGCTVIETADGRTLLYDAGALGRGDIARRIVAPYLWSRGISRIDEVFLSHADLDHYGALAPLLEHFRVGVVTCTPTFAQKEAAEVQRTLEALARAGVPVRTTSAGDRFVAGTLSLEVLHPPAEGPVGNENSRSLVLLARHGRQTLLLTGDLEGAGLSRVLGLAPVGVDVLMAPHHGSPASNTPGLARWARPRLVVASQGPKPPRSTDPYAGVAAEVLGTWPDGAVTLRCRDEGWVVETFRTEKRFVVRPGRSVWWGHGSDDAAR